MDRYCKRLIEVDFPIRRISAHARYEKSIRHGHISALHLWWARRPLSACRAILLACMWPDTCDALCPEKFKHTVRRLMEEWAKDCLGLTSEDSYPRFHQLQHEPARLQDDSILNVALLDFIADFSNWHNTTSKPFLRVARQLTEASNLTTDSSPGGAQLVIDPFAGGGSIPLEALRVGADAAASDLNPVAILLNKLILEYIPRFGNDFSKRAEVWGRWVGEQAAKHLAKVFPKDSDGSTPISYIWARTIACEGPGCGVELPLLTNLWLSKKKNRRVGLQIITNRERRSIEFEITENVASVNLDDGIVRRGAATCPLCGFTTPAANVKKQFQGRSGGAGDARLIAVVLLDPKAKGRRYRLVNEVDISSLELAKSELARLESSKSVNAMTIPNERFPYLRSIFNYQLLDAQTWRDLFSPRQLLCLVTYAELIRQSLVEMNKTDKENTELNVAVVTFLALTFDRLADLCNSLCRWEPVAECPRNLFGRQAIPIFWDFTEGVPIGKSSGSWDVMVQRNTHILDSLGSDWGSCSPFLCSAEEQVLPDDSADLLITDPPYYDMVPYADLSDFFYVWLKRIIGDLHPQLFADTLTPKTKEIVQLAERNVKEYGYKTKENFEKRMCRALSESRRVLKPGGIGVVFFAHKDTGAWESQLSAMIDAGWVITASWPIDTENTSRLRARGSAVLGSSIQLVCRPREREDGSLITDSVGDWRVVLEELPRKINAWMPRLRQEGIIGADAIFSCIGPALEVFSQYSSVEKASGEKVALNEYLEEVWAAVSREALSMIFEGADASGFEEDARLTAMWLWTLHSEVNGDGEEVEENGTTKSIRGYGLEFDAARKIAQGLGAHLEHLSHLIEVKGDTATLLSAGARTKYLFGKDAGEAPKRTRKKKAQQMTLDFAGELKELEKEVGDWTGDLSGRPGTTVLDQLHQSMILFGAGRGEALRRFLVEDSVGNNALYWRLAQALSALYPHGTDEKRWVDGVLARKKALGF